jgi:hypothetical protein
MALLRESGSTRPKSRAAISGRLFRDVYLGHKGVKSGRHRSGK